MAIHGEGKEMAMIATPHSACREWPLFLGGKEMARNDPEIIRNNILSRPFYFITYSYIYQELENYRGCKRPRLQRHTSYH
jgi:hypothetical protein